MVLSKHGVGYFERKGKVPSGSSFELFFKSKDMNDVLKSLTMVDIDVRSVSFSLFPVSALYVHRVLLCPPSLTSPPR